MPAEPHNATVTYTGGLRARWRWAGSGQAAGTVHGTRARYVEAFERITGASFARYLEEDVIAR